MITMIYIFLNFTLILINIFLDFMLILINIFLNYASPYVKFWCKMPVNNSWNLQQLPPPVTQPIS